MSSQLHAGEIRTSQTRRSQTRTSQTRTSQTRTSRKGTFTNPELEEALVAYCQLVSPFTCPAAEFEARRLELLSKLGSHVHYPDFDLDDAAREVCGTQLLQPVDIELEGSRQADSESSFATLCATRLLTVAEERAVFRRMHYYKFLAAQILSEPAVDQWALTRAQGLVKAALWHRDLVVRSNMRLVVSIVKKLPVAPTRHDELVSEGVVALLRAVDKFDPRRGYRFCTYATPVVRRQCFQKLQELNVDRLLFAQVNALGQCAAARNEGDLKADRAHWLAWRKRLPGLMGSLTRREQVIIRSRFCLGAHRRVKTLQRLADALKISKERVRQIERSALSKLRRAAQAQS